ncbi:VPS10 domain-containing receptor SorCS3 [Thelohanellus kitauei]|uniref:VPS10 domain-containing receptor SorCS3 n=1 Tax=Thelohanellus kitauei TaxID=669202 RepID=A0A0C2MLJ2_THEKT|nr:VPS10 domain-containing receptor SorCS3 [Thelohanellus kitauei]
MNDTQSKTSISFDNGKHFQVIKVEPNSSIYYENACVAEFELDCQQDLTTKYFHKPWVVKFHGIYHCRYSHRRHLFVSFNGGLTWKIFQQFSEDFIFLNHGSLILARQYMSESLWYSYDEGNHWYNDSYADVFKIKKIASINTLVASVVLYNKIDYIYTILNYDFSSIISICYITIDRTCQRDDYEIWYVPRYNDNCFDGEEVSYFKIKPSSMCLDKRTVIIPNISTCKYVDQDYRNNRHLPLGIAEEQERA